MIELKYVFNSEVKITASHNMFYDFIGCCDDSAAYLSRARIAEHLRVPRNHACPNI